MMGHGRRAQAGRQRRHCRFRLARRQFPVAR